MKRLRRKWWLVLALLVLLIAAAMVWWSSRSVPTITLLRVDDVSGERVPVFLLQNRSDDEGIYYDTVKVQTPEGEISVKANWNIGEENLFILHAHRTDRGHTLAAGQSVYFSLPNQLPNGKRLPATFQVGVDYNEFPSRIWALPGMSWLGTRLPASVWKPTTTWSETITP